MSDAETSQRGGGTRTLTHDETLTQTSGDSPAITPDQRWVIRDKDGVLIRGERVLMVHPEPDSSGNRQIVIEATRGTRIGGHPGRIGKIIEYALRRCFVLESEGPLREEARHG